MALGRFDQIGDPLASTSIRKERLVIAPVIAACAVGASLLGAFQAPQDIGALARILRARDSMLSRLELPFAAGHAEPTAGEHRWFSRGTFYREGGKVAVERMIGWEGESARLEKGVFDGARLQFLSKEADGREPILTIRAMRAEPFSTYLPDSFGLHYFGRPWSEVLESGTLHKILGREEVAGRSCLKILFDETPAEGGEYVRPVLVWIDTDETLLVIRYQTHLPFKGYVSLQSTEDVAERVAIQWGQKKFIPFLRLEVEEVAELEPGLWIAKRGRQSFPAAPHLSEVITTVDLAGTRTGHEIPAAIFDIEIQPGTHVDNRVEGTQLHLVEDGVTEVDVAFENLVIELAEADAVRPSLHEEIVPEPWETSSCGPNALYVLLRLLGADLRLSGLLAALTSEEHKLASLEALSGAARQLGFQARAVEMSPREFERYGGNLIAQLLEADGETHHFVMARAKDGGVRLVAPPGPVEVVSMDEFSRLWTGKALLVSGDPRVTSNTFLSPVRLSLILASFLAAIAAFAVRRPRIATSRSGASPS